VPAFFGQGFGDLPESLWILRVFDASNKEMDQRDVQTDKSNSIQINCNKPLGGCLDLRTRRFYAFRLETCTGSFDSIAVTTFSKKL
jgi:hypothetical protein